MGETIEVRRATAEHVEALLPMIADYWRFEAIPFDAVRVEPPLRRLLTEPRLGAGWIAYAGNTAAGYLLGVYVFSLEHRGLTAEIDELFVSAAHRGSGIGDRLLKAAEAEFRRAGCTNIALQLARDNDAARGFYRRHSYSERAGYELLDKRLINDRA
jgi:ribosomal protein S18 acetylase RimI-like enzyme